MRQIEQIIDEELIVRVQMNVAGRRRPFRIAQPIEVGDLRRVGFRRFSHPDPDGAPPLADGVAPDLGAARDHVLARHFDALPVDVEFKPVVAACEVIARPFAARERRRTVAATVFQRADLAGGVAKQHDLLVEKGPPNRLLVQVTRPDRGVPAISQEHASPPTGSAKCPRRMLVEPTHAGQSGAAHSRKPFKMAARARSAASPRGQTTASTPRLRRG